MSFFLAPENWIAYSGGKSPITFCVLKGFWKKLSPYVWVMKRPKVDEGVVTVNFFNSLIILLELNKNEAGLPLMYVEEVEHTTCVVLAISEKNPLEIRELFEFLGKLKQLLPNITTTE